MVVEKTKKPKISIVIPTWNGKEDLQICLPSIFKQSYKDFELIVVDNASTDGSVNFIKKNYPAKVIVNKKNLGYSGAVNVGVKHSKGKYVAILNNDTKLDKNWLIEMLKMLESEDSIAIVGSNIRNTSGFYSKNTFGTIISLLGDPIDVESEDKTFTFLAPGCSMLYKKKVIGIPPLDAEYFAYGEELYMAWLARLKGYDVKIAPNSRIIHYGPNTSTKIPRIVDFHKEKNKITNLLLFYEKKILIKITPILLTYIILNLIFSMFNGKFILRIRSYLWLISNWKRIMLKRKKIQMQRKVPDGEIFKYVTYKIEYGLGSIDKLISKLVYFYCIILNFNVYELQNKDKA